MSDSVQNLIAEPEDKGTRIDKYLSQELEDVSRSRIQKLSLIHISEPTRRS